MKGITDETLHHMGYVKGLSVVLTSMKPMVDLQPCPC